MVFHIKLAGEIIEINARYDLVYRKCINYVVESPIDKPSFVIEVSQAEMLYEEAEMQEDIWRLNGMYFSKDPQILEYAAIHRKITNMLFSYNTFIMHGSVVSLDGCGFMFSGHSGIGKSTRTRIWLQEYPSSIVINGDKPFIRITDQDVYAYGSPWCGKEGWNANASTPLRAILFLERADTGEKIFNKEITLGEALPSLLHQIHRPSSPDSTRKIIQLLKLLDGRVKFFHFRSTPTTEAIRLAYETSRPMQ